jgi:hypothetical protein
VFDLGGKKCVINFAGDWKEVKNKS